MGNVHCLFIAIVADAGGMISAGVAARHREGSKANRETTAMFEHQRHEFRCRFMSCKRASFPAGDEDFAKAAATATPLFTKSNR